jgi:hypothetical protein
LATARNTVERLSCEKNLKQLYPMIQRFVDAHGRLPLNEHGEFSLSQAGNNDQTAEFADAGLHACVGDDATACYLLATDVSPKDIGGSSASLPKILLYDRPGNHVLRKANGLLERRNWVVQEQALLLLTDGSVLQWRGDSPDYAAWAKGFADGTGDPYPPGIEHWLKLNYKR